MATVSDLVIDHLRKVQVKHVFGIPGDYILNFYNQLYNSQDIEIINTADESGAGFAADVYARMNGVGCVCVTYNVGSLKVANAIAGAYAERSPVVVISGSPGINERNEGFLLHHTSGSFESQKHIFENITCYSVILDNAETASAKLSEAFAALEEHKQPIFIELPRDIANKEILYSLSYSKKDEEKHIDEMADAFNRFWPKLSSKNSVILAGVEVSRFGFSDKLLALAEEYNIPIVTTLLGKSLIPETHPLYAGIFAGEASRPGVNELIKEADYIFMLGVMMTDLTMSFMPPSFDKSKLTMCSCKDGLRVGYSFYKDISFIEFMNNLLSSYSEPHFELKKESFAFTPVRNTPLTTFRFFEKINSILTDRLGIVADVGDCLFGASDLTIRSNRGFVGGAFYASMGLAIPGSLAMQVARPDLRPIVLVGDGSFQMSAIELGTIVSRELNPIIIVLNNRGYTTERFLLEGDFNNIPDWNYHKMTEVFGKGSGLKAETEDQFSEALDKALHSNELFIINAIVASDDISPALRRVTQALSKRI